MKDITIRADKFLSSLGAASRRNIESFLKNNSVLINNVKIKNPGDRINPKNKVSINGKEIIKHGNIYFLLNKPRGYISTTKDEFGRKNILNLIKTPERIFPIGRLDKDTHGLILLTNDGDLTNKLIHPKYKIDKVYELTIKGPVKQYIIEKLESSVMLDDGITSPAKAKIIHKNGEKTILRLTIHEGRNRQIRRMCDVLNIKLMDLKRINFGPIALKDLKTGHYRKLTKSEVNSLKSLGKFLK